MKWVEGIKGDGVETKSRTSTRMGSMDIGLGKARITTSPPYDSFEGVSSYYGSTNTSSSYEASKIILI